MNISDFKRIITSFADRPTDLEFDKGRLLTEIRGELIDAKLSTKGGVLYVEENGNEYTALIWIRDRIANLPQLAERILDFIPLEKSFVNPEGKLLDELEYDPDEKEQNVDCTLDKLIEIFNRKIPGTTSIVYLTSDAGEGKTTVINQLARQQASNFKSKQSDWLVLPIPLGGRPFLRFDDIVIASIVNNLRFRYLYYDSFLELVKLGLIVPAFDGFEEMFMQSSTGEALTATGGLINKLNSSGAILIAARKAYFDYKSFGSQAKLLDSINGSVSFARMAIERWKRDQFLEFGEKKGIQNQGEIFDLVSSKLGNPDHPILTRPVLVKQLFDVFKDLGDITELISKLESVNDYFPSFVSAIVKREADLKWIDTSGEPYKPILSVDEHYELLALIAEEMWINNSDSIKDSVLDLIAEMFAEHKKLSVSVTRQIKERIKQHALLINDNKSNPSYKFDHEEFYEFFLGVAISECLIKNKYHDLKNLLKKGPVPNQASDSSISIIKGKKVDIIEKKDFLESLLKGESQFSYVNENVSNLAIKLLSHENLPEIKILQYEFPINSFVTIDLKNITFEDCHFQNTSLHSSKLTNCTFINCNFDRIETNNSTTLKDVKLIECHVLTAFDITRDKGYYDQFSIDQFLKSRGIVVKHVVDLTTQFEFVEDEDLELTEKALRRFVRQNTPINDNIFKMRLGNKSDHFFKKIVPDLLEHNILKELEYIGQGQKRRFRLGVRFNQIDEALNESKGSYSKFLQFFSNNA